MSLIARGLVIIFVHGSAYLFTNAGRLLIYAIKYVLPAVLLTALVGTGFYFLIWWALVGDKERHSDTIFLTLIITFTVVATLAAIAHYLAEQEQAKQRIYRA